MKKLTRLNNYGAFALGLMAMLMAHILISEYKKGQEVKYPICEIESHTNNDLTMEWQSPDENTWVMMPPVIVPDRLVDSFKFVYKGQLIEGSKPYSFMAGRDSLGYTDQGGYSFGLNLDTIK